MLCNALQSSEDEIILRKVLYDVVILPEYSFLKPDRVAHQPSKQSLAIARLMVTYEATEIYRYMQLNFYGMSSSGKVSSEGDIIWLSFCRKEGDHTKAISYINAFSASHLPAELIKWVNNEIGTGNKSSGPNGYSPKAVLSKCHSDFCFSVRTF